MILHLFARLAHQTGRTGRSQKLKIFKPSWRSQIKQFLTECVHVQAWRQRSIDVLIVDGVVVVVRFHRRLI